MSKQSSAQRRRGVRASRLKRTRALNQAGLPTQAAVAERIADQEDLESVPRVVDELTPSTTGSEERL